MKVTLVLKPEEVIEVIVVHARGTGIFTQIDHVEFKIDRAFEDPRETAWKYKLVGVEITGER